MDNTMGNFVPITEEKFKEQMSQSKPLVFKEGEIIEIRGSRLRVQRIYRNKITFKLLPAKDNEQ